MAPSALSLAVLSSGLVACATVFTVMQYSYRTHLTLSDSVKLYEHGRGDSPSGMPGFYSAPAGTCLAPTAGVNESSVERLVGSAGAEDGRNRALVHLLRSAIADTPEGDVVDFGGSEALILRVLREMDVCGRRLWAIRGTPSAALDVYRLRAASCATPANCSVPVRTVSFLRISGHSFDDAATPLLVFYSRLEIGGFVFVDGYYDHQKIKSAVDSFRHAAKVIDAISHVEEPTRIGSPLIRAAWWQRTS